MNKRDKMMMEMLSNSINFYGEALAQAKSLNEFAVNVKNDKLTTATQKAVNGLSELVGHFSLQQDAIMRRNGAVRVPIEPEEKVYEIHFEGIHVDGNPLW